MNGTVVGWSAQTSGLDGYLDLTVRPTTLESGAAFSGIIVCGYMQDVYPGFAERGGCRRLPVKRGGSVRAVYFFDWGPLAVEVQI